METGADSALPPSQHIVRLHRAEAEAHVVSPRWPNLDAVSHAPITLNAYANSLPPNE